MKTLTQAVLAIAVGVLLVGGPAEARQTAAASGSASASTTSTPGPSDVVQTAAQNMLKDLDADRDAYRKDPSKVSALVDKYLLPNFDTTYAAQLVLGRHWRDATPEQRKRFVDAFYHSLLNNYGSALVDFTSDKLKVFPTTVQAGDERSMVRTEVKTNSGDRVSVNYYMRKDKDTGAWKAFDVVVEGISYVKSYKDDFGAQIDQQGLDAVISRLEKGEKPAEINKSKQKANS